MLKTWIEKHLWDDDVSQLLREVHDFATSDLGDDSVAARQILKVAQKVSSQSDLTGGSQVVLYSGERVDSLICCRQ